MYPTAVGTYIDYLLLTSTGWSICFLVLLHPLSLPSHEPTPEKKGDACRVGKSCT